jgi:DNA-binding HxlR family transcriptional regulator
MSTVATRYPQFCALARSLEMLGERWTLLIVRELLLGPKRFSDLKERLEGISASVLSQRLSRLEEDGLIQRGYLQPPAASNVFELTEFGRALEPAVFELIRWGARALYPARPGERREPEWLGLVLRAYARKGRVPRRSFEVRLKENGHEATFYVRGTAKGTIVSTEPTACDVRVALSIDTLFGLGSGRISASDAISGGLAESEGDAGTLAVFPDLFDMRR